MQLYENEASIVLKAVSKATMLDVCNVWTGENEGFSKTMT